MKNKIYCLICARKNSKGIKNKNILKFGDTTLVGHSISQAKKIKVISKVFISTDSNKIIKIAKSLKVTVPYKRPKILSGDKTPEIKVWKHFCNYLEEKGDKPDYIIVLPVTAPLRGLQDIKNAIYKINNKTLDIVFALTKSSKNPYFNIVRLNKSGIKPVCNSKKKIFRRQDAPECYDVTTVLYLLKFEYMKKSKNIFSTKKMDYIIVPKERSLDIDTKFDYQIARALSK